MHLLILLLAGLLLACEPPRVSGILTLHVQNQVPELIAPEAFDAGLNALSQELQAEGIRVQLVPDIPRRHGLDVDVVLVREQGEDRLGVVRVEVSPGSDWQAELEQQLREVVGR